METLTRGALQTGLETRCIFDIKHVLQNGNEKVQSTKIFVVYYELLKA